MVDDTKIEENPNTQKNKLIKRENKNKKNSKEISQQILKKMFISLLEAVGVTLYFIILNIAYSTMQEERLIDDIKVFSGIFLVIGIYFLEKAYKNDSGIYALSGIEFFVISLHSLSIMHIITLFKYDFRLYLLTSSYIFSIYFVLKTIILYTKGRKEYLNGLSDISDIVKKDKPIKKEARKRDIEKIEKKTVHKKEEKVSKKTPVKKATKIDDAEKVVKKKKPASKSTKKTDTSKGTKTEKVEKNTRKTTSKTTTKTRAKVPKTEKTTKKKNNE